LRWVHLDDLPHVDADRADRHHQFDRQLGAGSPAARAARTRPQFGPAASVSSREP
jgi:hypothetical protein